jgi:hypothetical protein
MLVSHPLVPAPLFTWIVPACESPDPLPPLSHEAQLPTPFLAIRSASFVEEISIASTLAWGLHSLQASQQFAKLDRGGGL